MATKSIADRAAEEHREALAFLGLPDELLPALFSGMLKIVHKANDKAVARERRRILRAMRQRTIASNEWHTIIRWADALACVSPRKGGK